MPQCALILSRQRAVRVDLARLRAFERKLVKALKLGRRWFNVCLVDDPAMAGLNGAYRGKGRATDVLSFPGQTSDDSGGELAGFLGDIAISAQTARRNARREGDSAEREIRRLILHGVLHLLGYDHETDHGEMTALEHSMRQRLRIAG